MSPSRRSLIAWTMAAWFAALVAVGQGWHFVPGNGHWVELPNGRGLMVGVTARSDIGRVPDAGPALNSRRPDELPLQDAGSCLICRLAGQAKLPRVAFDDPLSELLEQLVAERASPPTCIRISSPFHARAPPLV